MRKGRSDGNAASPEEAERTARMRQLSHQDDDAAVAADLAA